VTEKPTIVEALAAVMAEVQAVGKNNRNNEQGYDFRGIDAVVNAVGPVLRKHKVIAAPVSSVASFRDVLTVREKRSRECTVSVTYRFYGPAGDFIDAQVPGESMDFGDKGAAKAMSVAYRIALLQVLCIPTHEPDADSQSYERSAERPGWDPIEQEDLFGRWQLDITKAATFDDLTDVLRRIQRSKDLSPANKDKLTKICVERKVELEQAVPA